MKTITQLLLSFVVLCLAAVVPTTQAVVPPPDGSYPSGNTAEGQNALFSLTTGGFNTAVGFLSLRSNTIGSFNTATGAGSLLFTISDQNTAFGAAALLFNTVGENNTATGAAALLNNTIGSENAADGYQGLFSNTTGGANTAIGSFALQANTEGAFNTANGSQALYGNTTGDANTAIGFGTLVSNTTGNDNTALGFEAGSGVTTANNVIAIGTAGANVSNGCFIGQIYTDIQPQVGIDPDLVTINSDGRLGRANVSSRRYKHDIQPMQKASEAIYALKPVSFRYHKQYDQTQTIAFGLIAEEVAEVNSDLVGRNREGQPESVRYEQVNAMLLNEFLKAHKMIEEQQATISQLREAMATVVTRLNEQDSKIQRVSDQVQINSPEARVVVRNR